MDLHQFEKLPVLGILRGINISMVDSLVKTIMNSGLKTIEVTMNTENAPEIIKEFSEQSAGNLTIGAGTVMTMEDIDRALNAGATFIVSPIIKDDIINFCVKNSIPVFPGALTPNEIYHAWAIGASMVKVFPAKVFGPAYFKEIKAPMNDVKLMATGGITQDNIQDYFSNKADAVSFGASIFRLEWMDVGKYHLIEQEIVKLLKGYSDFNSSFQA